MKLRPLASTAALVRCLRCNAREHISWGEVEHVLATDGYWGPRRPCHCPVTEVGVHFVTLSKWIELDPLRILETRP